MATWESTKAAAKAVTDYVPKLLVKWWDMATNGDKVADTKKALDKANQAKQYANAKREQALTDYKKKRADLNAANEDITKANALVEHDTNYLNNVIRDPRIKNLFERAAGTVDPAEQKVYLDQLAKELIDDNYVQFSGNADTRDIERLKKLYEYVYPSIDIKGIPDAQIYEHFLNNKYGNRDFKQFFNSLEDAATKSLNSSQVKLDTAQTLANNSSKYAQRTQDFNDASLARINARDTARTARTEADVARRAYDAALNNQANKLRGMRGAVYGLPIGLPAAYYLAPKFISNLKEQYDNYLGQPKSPEQAVFNEAGNNTLTANSESLPDPSIQGQSFRLPGMVTANPVTPSAPPSTPAPAPREAPATVPPPASVPQEQPVAVAPAPSSDDTYGYLDKALNRPKQPFTPTIQGRRTPSQEAALAKGMFDYRRQSARNALGGLSPAEAVQRGIIPYEALAYV